MNILDQNERREQQHRAELAALEDAAARRTRYVSPATFTDAPAAARRRALLAMTPAGQAVLAAEAAKGAR